MAGEAGMGDPVLEGLRGITYSEFDNIVGPQLRFSYPPDVLPKEAFEPLSDFVIVGKHLCGKIILVKTDELQFLNYSVSIDNPKYERNTLLFSFGFVLAQDVPPEPFEPLLRKLSSVMVSLEVETEFLFQAKQRLEPILQTLYKNLRHRGEAFIELDKHNFLALKLFKPISPQPPEILDHQVPVLVYSKNFLSALPWDISLQHLLPCIDGVKHVTRIARDAEMDVDCAKRCLRALLFYKCVVVADVFRFSNVYQLQKRVALSPAVIADVESFCAVGSAEGADDVAIAGAGAPTGVSLGPRGRRIAQLLQSLRPGRTLADILCGNSSASTSSVADDETGVRTATALGGALQQRQPSQPGTSAAADSAGSGLGGGALAGLDLRRLLAVAQARGIVRRLHEFPALGRARDGSPDDDDGEGDGDGDESSETQSSLGSGQSSIGRLGTSINIAGIQGAGRAASLKPVGSGSSAGNVADAQQQQPNWAALLTGKMLLALDGTLSLDEICCKFDVPPAAVLQHPGVYIVYK